MFTTYRVPPLRRSGLGEGVRPINAWFANTLCAFKRLAARVSASHAGRSAKPHGKCRPKLINAA